MNSERRQILNSLIKGFIRQIRDEAKFEYDNNANANGVSGGHGNLDKRCSRLLREFKNKIVIQKTYSNQTIEDAIELNYVKEKLEARAKKYEHDGRDKNHPFK